jgi:heme/copper-type cytochrome/quinol oxidase subunit 2
MMGQGDEYPDPQGPIGVADKTVLIDLVAIMLAIVLLTIVAIIAFAFWLRQSNTRAAYRPDFAYSGRIELVVWSIPALTVILLGGAAWIGSHRQSTRELSLVRIRARESPWPAHPRSSRGRRPLAVLVGMAPFPPIAKMTSSLIAFGASPSKAYS